MCVSRLLLGVNNIDYITPMLNEEYQLKQYNYEAIYDDLGHRGLLYTGPHVIAKDEFVAPFHGFVRKINARTQTEDEYCISIGDNLQLKLDDHGHPNNIANLCNEAPQKDKKNCDIFEYGKGIPFPYPFALPTEDELGMNILGLLGAPSIDQPNEYLFSTREIQPGEVLFTEYGDEFWLGKQTKGKKTKRDVELQPTIPTKRQRSLMGLKG